MAKRRRTGGIQRRERASTEALSRRLDDRGSGLPDWRLLAIGGVLVVGVIVIVLVLVVGSTPNPNEGIAEPDDGGVHVSVGANCRDDPASCNLSSNPYSSLPATSGPHWEPSGIANWGVYTTPQPESQVVHNLEHGGIVIWYDAQQVAAADVQTLTDYVNAQVRSGISGRYKFILTPWGGSQPLPAPIVATAWRYLLPLETADTSAIADFARAHYQHSPEPNGGPAPPA
jgi:hypothetical protein